MRILGLMCERYAIPEQRAAEQEFRPAQPWWKFSRSFNVAAERCVPVVRFHQGETEGVMLRWGLIPDWAEGDAGKGWTAHAHAYELAQSNLLAGAWSRGQRCILPMSGFYGWQLRPARYRQPFFIHLPSRAVFGVAALWDHTVSEDDDDVVESCALLTLPPNPLVAEVNNTSAYMPAILRSEDYDAWLTGSAAEAGAVLRTYPGREMAAHPISPRINSLKFDDALLIRPVRVAEPWLALSG